ncbi:methyltransferase [Dyadobacter luteus]|jgi:predicted TPR repeat methyltransferase|uniref:Methyltransferase n=1 Tax=Dyadobacter luteus TaxID=2259619 RepID=A0A3D8YG78_9BACT|nr:SAM-dependent methyltransferase [Dyadobacter luteus]REA63661.1 methyltransferase [Dyadobacter luteus]
MSQKKKTFNAAYFNELYSSNPDPWNFEHSEYEKAKYEQTMLMIPDTIYNAGLEIGCSNGLLTLRLRQRCRNLLAVDSSSVAVEKAAERLAGFTNVTFAEMEVPAEFAEGKFDLIVFSEVGYFMTEQDLLITREKIVDALSDAGHLLLVHWTGPVAEFPLTGERVHELFLECASSQLQKSLVHLQNHTDPQYRMDMFQKL